MGWNPESGFYTFRVYYFLNFTRCIGAKTRDFIVFYWYMDAISGSCKISQITWVFAPLTDFLRLKNEVIQNDYLSSSNVSKHFEHTSSVESNCSKADSKNFLDFAISKWLFTLTFILINENSRKRCYYTHLG